MISPEPWAHVSQEGGGVGHAGLLVPTSGPASAGRRHRRTTYCANGGEGDDRAQEVTGQEPAVGGQCPHHPREKTWEMRVHTHTDRKYSWSWLRSPPSGIMENFPKCFANGCRIDNIWHNQTTTRTILQLLVKFGMKKKKIHFKVCFISNIVKMGCSKIIAPMMVWISKGSTWSFGAFHPHHFLFVKQSPGLSPFQ